MCKHVKQLVIETHPEWATKAIRIKNPTPDALPFRIMFGVEKCFRLFRRDTRFFKEDGFVKTEFQEPRTYKIPTSDYPSEIDLIKYMVTFGELYFVNKNFI